MNWEQEDDPLARHLREPTSANVALRDYATMGGHRSLRILEERYANEPLTQNPPTRRFATIATWSTRYEWQARVERFDTLERERELQQWRERREMVREQDWQKSVRLRELGDRILDAAPSFIRRSSKIIDSGSPRIIGVDGQVISEGRPAQTVITIALDSSALVRIEKLGSDFARLASEMETERKRQEVTGEDGAPIIIEYATDFRSSMELEDDRSGTAGADSE